MTAKLLTIPQKDFSKNDIFLYNVNSAFHLPLNEIEREIETQGYQYAKYLGKEDSGHHHWEVSSFRAYLDVLINVFSCSKTKIRESHDFVMKRSSLKRGFSIYHVLNGEIHFFLKRSSDLSIRDNFEKIKLRNSFEKIITDFISKDLSMSYEAEYSLKWLKNEKLCYSHLMVKMISDHANKTSLHIDIENAELANLLGLEINLPTKFYGCITRSMNADWIMPGPFWQDGKGIKGSDHCLNLNLSFYPDSSSYKDRIKMVQSCTIKPVKTYEIESMTGNEKDDCDPDLRDCVSRKKENTSPSQKKNTFFGI